MINVSPTHRSFALEVLGWLFLCLYIHAAYYLLLTSASVLELVWNNIVYAKYTLTEVVQRWVCDC